MENLNVVHDPQFDSQRLCEERRSEREMRMRGEFLEAKTRKHAHRATSTNARCHAAISATN